MGEHTGNQFVYPTQKQGRDAHPEREGLGFLSREEEYCNLESRQRHTPEEECGHPE